MTKILTLQELFPIPSEEETTLVIFLRGIPGSGKSTFAKAHFDAYPSGTVIRINNDDLSTMLFGVPWGSNPVASELLASARIKLLEACLAQSAIKLIFVDNTNLQTSTVNTLSQTATNLGAKVIVDDRFLSVDVEECIRRDSLRVNPVGEGIIRKMARQASRLTPWTPNWKPSLEEFLQSIELYHNSAELTPSIIVDIDGTLAIMGDRDPYTWRKVGRDLPNTSVVDFVKRHIQEGHNVIIMSGRDGVCRKETQEWLDRYVSPGLPLFMRTQNDKRPDYIVKNELFRNNIVDNYHVTLVLDDRTSVVKLWRALGLNCWQVNEGDF